MTRRAPFDWRLSLATAIAIGAMTLSTGCAAVTERLAADRDERPMVLTTFTVLEDIAQNVAGEHLRVESITKIGAEIHGYEPTPHDVTRATSADLILDNGLGLEAWFDQFVATVDAPHVVVSEGVDVLSVDTESGAETANPHAWMSPRNVETYVDNIVAAFSELDPAHAASYRSNGDSYRRDLRALHEETVRRLDPLPAHQRALVTCEGAFSYLAKDWDLAEEYLWPVNAEQQATPRRVTSAIQFVRANDVPAVFCESTVSDKAMRQVMTSTDTVFGGTLYVDSLSAEDGPVPTYLDLIRHTADTIVRALMRGNP